MAKKKFTAKNIRQGHTVWVLYGGPFGFADYHVRGFLVGSHNDDYFPGGGEIIERFNVRILRAMLKPPVYCVNVHRTYRSAVREAKMWNHYTAKHHNDIRERKAKSLEWTSQMKNNPIPSCNEPTKEEMVDSIMEIVFGNRE